jgi:hypothetical protein
MTQLRTILQTPAAVAPVAAEPVTVTINAEPVTVYETKTEVINQVETQFVTQVQVETQYVTQVDVQIVTEVAPAPVSLFKSRSLLLSSRSSPSPLTRSSPRQCTSLEKHQ